MERINNVDANNILSEINDFIRFVFFPVGHGSCTLVSFPPEEPEGDRIYGAIDCRDATARPIRAYLSDPWFDDEVITKKPTFNLRFVALTHYHEDHLLGIDHLLGNDTSSFTCKHFLCPFPPAGEVARRRQEHPKIKKILSNIQKLAPSPSFLQIYQDCSWIYRPKDSLPKDIFKAITIAPPSSAIQRMKEWRSQKNVTPFNVLSSAIRFQWGHCSIIIGGDVEVDEWKEIISDLESKGQLHLLSANVALCSHHGGNGNPDILWQRISRCSSFHKQGEETEKRVSRTLIIVPCGSGKEESPSMNSLRTFVNANSWVRCTSPAKTCLNLHAGEQPSCISDNNTDECEELIERLPGENPALDNKCDLPSFFGRSRNLYDFKKGSICVDIFPKIKPRVFYHNGKDKKEVTKECSCVTKLGGVLENYETLRTLKK